MGKDLDDIFEGLIIDEFGDVGKDINNEVSESIESASDAKRQDTLINNEHVNALKQDNEELEKQVSSFRKLSDILKKVKDLHSSSNDTKESPVINSSISSKSPSTIVTGEQILNEMSKTKSGAIDSNRTQIFVDDFKQGIEESLKQAAENAISNILIDLSKKPEKIGLLQKGIIANIEKDITGPDEKVRNINTRRTIESATERRRYEDWLEKHQKPTQYSRDNNAVLSKNNENVLTMRQLKTEFEVLFKSVKYETKQNGLMTNEEGELYKKSKGFKDELNNSLDILEEKAKKISKLEDKLYNRENTSEEQEKLIKDLNEATTDYNLILQNTVTTYRKANETMTKGLESVRSGIDFIDDPEVLRKKKYNDAKYALFRTKSQTKDLQANGYIDAFSTTGYIGDSFRKTMFNRATGYRQQRGLVGLASNIGYNNSGVATSIALGGAATALKKLGDVALNFTKQSLEAYGQIESIRTNLGIVYGSQSQANNTFEEIAQYATKSPFGVETVSQFAVQLKQSGVYASELMTVLKEIGDVAGGNQQKFGNIANAFAQIEANGKATTRQLREFATAGIPIYAQLSKQLGKSVEQIRQMTAQGQISSSIIEEAFAQLTGPNGMFNNAVNIGAKTFNARKQNLSDIWQLAKSEYGDVLVNGNFGVRSAQNESFGKSILSSLEDLGETVENIFKKMNIDRNLENVYLREDLLEKYQKELEKAEKKNNTEDIVKYSDLISELRNISTVSEDRATKVNAYDYYNTELDKYKSLTPVQKIFDITKWNTSQKIDEIQAKLDSLKPSKNTSLVESYIQSGSDKLDKTTTRGNEVESLSKIPTSLYLLKQESDELWKQTVQGKKELEELKKADWDKMIELYNKLSPMIDNSGNLLKGELYNGKQLHELLNSGIMSVAGTRNINPENMSFNSESVKNLTGEAKKYKLEQVNSNYESLVNATLTLMQRQVNDLSEQSIKGLKNFYESVIGQSVQYVENNGKKYFESTVNVSDLVGKVNDNNLITNVTNAFSDLLAILNKFNPEFAEDFNEYIGTERVKVDKPRNANDVLTQNADPYPLWQRIISNTLGVDLNLFKNTGNGKGWATNGNQALELYQKQMEKQTIKSVISATMSSMGTKRMLSLMADKNNYSGPAAVVSNNSQDGTKQINWKNLYKNFSDFSMSLEASAEVTRAYADSLANSQGALEEFISSSITQMEEPANIWDDNYQKVLGEYAKNIKATDANAFDMLFEELAPGVIKLRENALDAAYSLYQLNEKTAKAALEISGYKEQIKTLEQDNRKQNILNNESVLNGGRYRNLGFGLNEQNSQAFYKTLTDKVIEVTSEGNVLAGEDPVKLQKTYFSTGSIGQAGFVNRNYEMKYDDQIDELERKINSLRSELDKLDINTLEAEKNLKQKEWMAYAGGEGKNENNRITLKAKEDAYNLAQTAYNNALSVQGELTKAQLVKSDLEGKRDSAQSEFNAQENTNKAKDQIYETLKDIFEKLLEQYKLAETSEAIDKYNEARARPEKFYDGLFGMERYGKGVLGKNPYVLDKDLNPIDIKNTKSQQSILDEIGQEGSWRDYRNSLMQNSEVRKSLMSSNYLNENNKSTVDYYGNMDNKTFDRLLNNGAFESIAEIFDKIIEKEMQAGIESKNLVKTFSELGETSKGIITDGLLKGFNSTMQSVGKNAKLMKDNIISGEEASKEYTKIWKDVGAEMLNSIGAAATHAGLALIENGAKTNTKATMIAGAALVAAGGVMQIMGGFLGADDDKEKDKREQEEERLKTLRDLLKEIIDQAKVDAQYYENHMRHENAISVQSVNDAIITPQGNVVTTHPDDYLIATKTPGSLVGAGQTKVESKVSITVVNASGTAVQAEETNRKTDKDGNVNIEVMLTSMMGQKIADGDMDPFFEAREARIHGVSYVG